MEHSGYVQKYCYTNISNTNFANEINANYGISNTEEKLLISIK
jgi:hypothetical protein